MSTLTNLLDIVNAAVVMRQPLKPVEGDDAIIFPPTFLGVGYNIDQLVDRNGAITGNVCLIDSVGSQANRMEPIFKDGKYADLVPRITVEIRKPQTDKQEKDGEPGELLDVVNLLDAGHRIADAIVRFSDLSDDIENTFKAAEAGNAQPLAKLAPTSLVFGCWDSRKTHVKLPRIVRSVIMAHNVQPRTRSAVYSIPTDPQNYVEAGAVTKKDVESAESKKETKASKAGLANALATKTLGGVGLTLQSKLFRESVLSLAALRRLKVTNDNGSSDDEATRKLRSYILGLSLIAFTAPQETFLRMGCELTPDPDNPAVWELVKTDGTREGFSVSHDDALAFAKEARDAFGVGEARTAIFDAKKAKEALSKKDKDQES